MFAIRKLFVLLSALSMLLLFAVGTPQSRATASTASAATNGLRYLWHTFYGVPAGVGELNGIATDTAGNVYVLGHTSVGWGVPLHAHSGDYDIVIIKLNRDGQYQWHTFFGGSPTTGEDGDDEGGAIAVGTDGNVIVTGYSDRGWMGPGNASPLLAHGGDAEYMFALKLSGSGQYLWHTFFQPGRATAVALGDDAIYIAGDASRTWGSPQHAYGGRVMLLKLNGNGVYGWHTYFGAGGGAADEVALGVAVNHSDNTLYVTGQSPNTWLGANGEAPLNNFSGGADFSSDIFVLKLDATGAYAWHTFYGAAATDDSGTAVALDAQGNVYVAGQTFDSWGQPLNPAMGERDLVVLKLGPGGNYQWHTNMGGGGNDYAAASIVVRNGYVYVAGESSGSWLGPAGQPPTNAHSTFSDLVVLKLGTFGDYRSHTFHGSAEGQDRGRALALDNNGDVLVTGRSTQGWLGAQARAPIRAHSGNVDGEGFVLKLLDHAHQVSLPLLLR